MLKNRRIFFLLWTLLLPYHLLQADLPEQLMQLAGGLEQLKNKLNELGTALYALKEKLENKEDEVAEVVNEVAADSSKLEDLLSVIVPHLEDEIFVAKVESAFKKLPYETFVAVEENFVKNVSDVGEDSNKVEELFLNVHEAFAQDDIEKKDFDKAKKKMQKLYELETSYSQRLFKTYQEFFVKKLIQNSESLTVDQLEAVVKLIDKNYKKEFFVKLIKKVLTHKDTFSLDLRNNLAQEIIKSIEPGLSVEKLREILDEKTLSLFYKNQAIKLLKGGIKSIDVYGNTKDRPDGHDKDKPHLLLQGKELIANELRAKLISEYTDKMFDEFKKLLKDGLSDKQIKLINAVVESVTKKALYSSFYKNLYNAFIDEATKMNQFKNILSHRIKDNQARSPLAERILKHLGYFDSAESDDWSEGTIEFPVWFETFAIPEDIKKEILLDIFKSLFLKDLKNFKENCEKLKSIESPTIQDILLKEDFIAQLDAFYEKSKIESPKAAELSKKIDRLSADYTKAEEEEAKKRTKAGGIFDGVKDTFMDALRKIRSSVTGTREPDSDDDSDDTSSED